MPPPFGGTCVLARAHSSSLCPRPRAPPGERSRPPARAPIGFRTREGLVDPLGRPRAPHPNVIDPFRIQGNILRGSATPSDLSRQSGTQRGPSAHTDSMRNGRRIRPLPSIGCGICCNPPNTMNIVNPIRQGDCLRVPYAHCPCPVPALCLCVRPCDIWWALPCRPSHEFSYPSRDGESILANRGGLWQDPD